MGWQAEQVGQARNRADATVKPLELFPDVYIPSCFLLGKNKRYMFATQKRKKHGGSL